MDKYIGSLSGVRFFRTREGRYIARTSAMYCTREYPTIFGAAREARQIREDRCIPF